jgi:hypothetical protein
MKYNLPNTTPKMVFEKETYRELEQKLEELSAEFRVREIEVTFTGERYFFGDIKSTSDAYTFIRDSILSGIEVQEHFFAIYLNQANHIIGYYHHSTGTINSTPVDIEIVSAVALKTLAKAVIISHNHPSGNLYPSDADKVLTRQLKQALKLFDVYLIDHLIITKNGYYSFAEHSEKSLSGPPETGGVEEKLREEVLRQLKRVTEANSPALFSMIQTKEGYAHAEEMIIRKVLHDQLLPAAVIPLIEQEFDMI